MESLQNLHFTSLSQSNLILIYSIWWMRWWIYEKPPQRSSKVFAYSCKTHWVTVESLEGENLQWTQLNRRSGTYHGQPVGLPWSVGPTTVWSWWPLAPRALLLHFSASSSSVLSHGTCPSTSVLDVFGSSLLVFFVHKTSKSTLILSLRAYKLKITITFETSKPKA